MKEHLSNIGLLVIENTKAILVKVLRRDCDDIVSQLCELKNIILVECNSVVKLTDIDNHLFVIKAENITMTMKNETLSIKGSKIKMY